MCALTECTWYFEDLAFCPFQHFWTERFNFAWHLINICLLHSHFLFERSFFLLVLAALLQIYPFIIWKICPLPRKTHSRCICSTLYWSFIYLFERLVNEKKQYYTFNNSSMLQMLNEDHMLFLKNNLKIFSRLSVCSLYNSESGPKILQFLCNSNHQIV